MRPTEGRQPSLPLLPSLVGSWKQSRLPSTEDKIETQRAFVGCPRSHNEAVVEDPARKEV